MGLRHEVPQPRMAHGLSHLAWARGLELSVLASASGSRLGPAVKFQGSQAPGLRLEAWALNLGLWLVVLSHGH